MKTGSQIEQDFVNAIIDRGFEVNGGVYKQGMRPVGSEKEDVVVSFLTGLGQQVQTGVVNVNVYVQNISELRNSTRCLEVEQILLSFVENLHLSGYRVDQKQMIQTFKAGDIDQHFVNLQIKFYHFNN